MLPGKRKTNNGYCQNNTKDKMRKRNPDTAQENPENIKDGRQAPRRAGDIPHLPAERKQSEYANFETLHAKRNSDNCQAKHKAGYHVLQKYKKSAKNEPNDVTYQVHNDGVIERVKNYATGNKFNFLKVTAQLILTSGSSWVLPAVFQFRIFN